VFYKLSSFDFSNTSLAYLKSFIFSSYSAGMVFIPYLDVSRFMTIESGTAVYLSRFLILIDKSTQSGMLSHYSAVTFANYLFKSTNLEVIELSICTSFLAFYYYYFNLSFSLLPQSLFSQKSYASSASRSSSSRFPLEKRAPEYPSHSSNFA